MFPVVGKCPVCGETMNVTRLHCRTCDSALEGQFSLGRFYRLSSQQLAFIETFIRCEGKLTRVQEELNISYPTARARLTDVIRALGYEVNEEAEAIAPAERKSILEKLATGQISSEQAVELLKGK
ncbi:MAG: DUF2089 domain-containing protein [Chloroflexi bacterium]|nr:MAG: DUF2089 domain-containing protein [Chloroflexota bacterium]